MQKLVGICPACEKKSRFDILTVVTETKESTLHFCSCHSCRNQVYVATIRLVPSDYKPILTVGNTSDDAKDSSPHAAEGI